MNKIGIQLIAFFLVAASYFDGFAQDTLLLSLPEAIEIGTKYSVDAAVARNQYVSAYWEYRTFRAEQLPEIGFRTTLPFYSMSYNPIQNPVDGSYSYTQSNFSRLDGAISLSQIIPFTGGKLSFSSSIQRLQQYGENKNTTFMSKPYSIILEQPLGGYNREYWLRKIEPVKMKEARQKLVSENENTAIQVIHSFFDLLLARVNLDMAIQNRNNSEKLFDIAKTKHEIGRLSESDLLQLRSSLLKAEAAWIKADATMSESMLQLRSFLRLNENTFIIPITPVGLSENAPLLSYEDVLALALENHSFSQNIQRRILEASRDISKAKAERWDAQLFVSYGMSGIHPSFSGVVEPDNWRNDRSVQIGISIPILDWGKRKGKIAVAKANKEVLESTIEKEQMDFNQHIQVLVMNFNNQPRKLLLATENDSIAQRRYQISVEAFILGKIDVLNLNDAQYSKDEARRNFMDEMWKLWAYYYQIRGLTLYDFTHNEPLKVLYD